MTMRCSVECCWSLVVLMEGGDLRLCGRRETCLKYVRSGGQGRLGSKILELSRISSVGLDLMS